MSRGIFVFSFVFVILTGIFLFSIVSKMSAQREREAPEAPEQAASAEAPATLEERLLSVVSQAAQLRAGERAPITGSDVFSSRELEMAMGQEHTLSVVVDELPREVLVKRTKPDAVLFTLGEGFPAGKLVVMGNEALTVAGMEAQTARIIFEPADGSPRQTYGWHESRPEGYELVPDSLPLLLAEQIFAGIPFRAQLRIVPGSMAERGEIMPTGGRSIGRPISVGKPSGRPRGFTI